MTKKNYLPESNSTDENDPEDNVEVVLQHPGFSGVMTATVLYRCRSGLSLKEAKELVRDLGRVYVGSMEECSHLAEKLREVGCLVLIRPVSG